MITAGYVQKMAAYNRWMNRAIYDACEALSDADRRKDCGAFFGSIHATLNHILWADQIWMHRLAGTARPAAPGIPASVSQYEAWEDLRAKRAAFDEVIGNWAVVLEPSTLEGDLTWHSGATGRELSKRRWVAITHMFNHQTHHRGQVHCLLTQFGVKTPVTDIPFMPEQ